MMNHDDERLSRLLKKWPEIEPRAAFTSDVWRRIRLASAGAPERSTAGALGRRWWWQPAWAVAAAVVVSVVLGSFAGRESVSRSANDQTRELQFLSPTTLSGGYVKLAVNPATTPRGERP